MIDYQRFYQQLSERQLHQWRELLIPQIAHKLAPGSHGKLPMWQQTLAQLPAIKPDRIALGDPVTIGSAEQLPAAGISANDFSELLKNLHPWRKGPFHLFGIHIDTEWRSDWKWQRLQDHITPLDGRQVLDVGGGNGYHGWRMVGAGADWVVGIDPTLVFTMQYQVMQFYIDSHRHTVLPIGIEQLPAGLGYFDTVFSMGILYHRKSPIAHLLELRDCLRSGGELVLETLVIEGEEGMTLMPENRYAKMRNVWFFPSVATLAGWLRKTGFKQIRCVDVTPTTTAEQRSTEWMQFESLANFLDPADHSKTIEGYPGPRRAIMIANAP